MTEAYRAACEAQITRARSGAIEGYAAVFDSAADVGKGRWEEISRSAFEAVEGDDVAALVQHDPRLILGRSSAGTLRTALDDHGVHFEIPSPPDTTYARDLAASLERGDLQGASFGVVPGKSERATAPNGSPMVRHIAFARWLDVSIVTFPAYDSTSVTLRSVDWAAQPQHYRRISIPAARSRLLFHTHQYRYQKESRP